MFTEGGVEGMMGCDGWLGHANLACIVSFVVMLIVCVLFLEPMKKSDKSILYRFVMYRFVSYRKASQAPAFGSGLSALPPCCHPAASLAGSGRH